MVRKFVLAAGCAALLIAATPPRKIFPYPYTQQDLPNGLRLIVTPTGFPNIVATYIVVQTGSRNEVEPGHTGFAHLFEHLMFKGTPQYPPARYDQTLRRMGASSNAFTNDDYTCYYTVFSKEDLDTALAMEADRFQNLKYSETEFRTETLAVLGEYNKSSSSPFAKLSEALRETAFDQSTYKHTAMGFVEDIRAMPEQYDYSTQFFQRYYRPEYTTILVAGDVQPKAVREIVDRYWGAWKRGDYKPEIPTEPQQQAPQVRQLTWPSPTLPLIAIGYKGPAYTDSAPDTAALDALAQLAFSPNSDLYQKLVVKDQTVDFLGASAPRQMDSALFQINARVKKAADLDSVRDQILATVRGFQETAVDAARLDAVRKRLRYAAAMQMQSSDAIAGLAAAFVALRRTPETMNRLFDQYSQMKPEDVQQAAAKYLGESSRTIVTMTYSGGAK